jgi:hypothetical protein
VKFSVSAFPQFFASIFLIALTFLSGKTAILRQLLTYFLILAYFPARETRRKQASDGARDARPHQSWLNSPVPSGRPRPRNTARQQAG